MATFTLMPAYGRDYKSKSAIIADFVSNKDFRATSFQGGDGYINFAEMRKKYEGNEANVSITFRYKKLTMVFVSTLANLIKEAEKAAEKAVS